MRSSNESEGFRLLNKLKTKSGSAPIPLRITFAGILIPVNFSGIGSISAFDDVRLKISGDGFEIGFDLRDAAFGNTATAEGLRAIGVDPVLCGEGTEIDLEWGKISLATIPDGKAN